MKTPMLIEVPKDSLSRKEKLNLFKKLNQIETHNAGGEWIACLMPKARGLGYGVKPESDLFDCICKVGRLMDESGIACYGRTEKEAIQNLCSENEILWQFEL